MKPLLTLYLKELKEHRTYAVLVLAATIGIHLVVFARLDLPPGPGDVGLGILALIPIGLPLVVAPFLLAHIYSSDRKRSAHHLELSLPVPRWWIRLSKWCAVLSVSGFHYGVACGGVYLLYLWAVGHLQQEVSLIGFPDFWVIAVVWWFAISLLSTGLITAMEGLRSGVKRFRTLLAGSLLGLCLIGFSRLLDPGVAALQFLGSYHFQSLLPGGVISDHSISLPGLAFSAVYGLLMLALGLYLYNRYAEI